MFHQRRAELRKFAIPSASGIKVLEPRTRLLETCSSEQPGHPGEVGITRTDLPGERKPKSLEPLCPCCTEPAAVGWDCWWHSRLLCCQDTQPAALCHLVPVRSAVTALHQAGSAPAAVRTELPAKGTASSVPQLPQAVEWPVLLMCWSVPGRGTGWTDTRWQCSQEIAAFSSGIFQSRELLVLGPGMARPSARVCALPRLGAGTTKPQIFLGVWWSLALGLQGAVETLPAGQGWGTAAGWRSSPCSSGLVIPLQRPPAGECLPHLCHSRTRTKAAEESSPGLDLAHSSWPQSSTALAVGLPWGSVGRTVQLPGTTVRNSGWQLVGQLRVSPRTAYAP